jgi:hypothetical protein
MKKIGILCLALVLALGTMGIGLAQWTETLTITGNATTGDLSVKFGNPAPSTTDSDGGMANGGTCTATVSGVGTESETLTITITNGYPCYTCTVDFDVENDGSIPVDLGGVLLSGVPAQISVTATGANAQDLAVGGKDAGQIVIHVEDSAAENGNYSFTGTIGATQFNMP